MVARLATLDSCDWPDVEPGFAKMGESILAETPGNALLRSRLLDIGKGRGGVRLIMSGTFARFPKLKIILGHMGEGIPFWLQRIDNRYLLQVKIGAVTKLPRLPSEYFLENFVITTADVTSKLALRLSLEVLGAERILFAADYPYEDDAEAVRFLDGAALTERERKLIAHENAEQIFGLA